MKPTLKGFVSVDIRGKPGITLDQWLDC